MELKMMRCGLCNSRTEVREMKYHKSGEYLLCSACHEKQVPGAKVIAQKPAVPSPKRQERLSYRCRNCSYSFSRNKDHPVNACPYCGRDGISLVEGSMAQHLIDKVF